MSATFWPLPPVRKKTVFCGHRFKKKSFRYAYQKIKNGLKRINFDFEKNTSNNFRQGVSEILKFQGKKMFYQDEEKIECALGNRDFGFLAGQESRKASCFSFWCRDLRHLFVSDSWYCQIRTTRLIMFFL